MARTKTKKNTTGRGSPEAIEKRRVARQLNTLISGKKPPELDGRTAKKLARLTKTVMDKKKKPVERINALWWIHQVHPKTIKDAKLKIIFAAPVELHSEIAKTMKSFERAYDMSFKELGGSFAIRKG